MVTVRYLIEGSEDLNKNVIIKVRATQTDTGKNINKLELVTEGKYYKKGELYYVTYKESEVTGMEGTTTTLKVHNNVVTLLRFGVVNNQFIFEEGQKHISYYDTPNGAFMIGVQTKSINVDIDDTGGEIKVDYLLEMDNKKLGENDLYMHIREVGT